jgi:hypothetical protein
MQYLGPTPAAKLNGRSFGSLVQGKLLARKTAGGSGRGLGPAAAAAEAPTEISAVAPAASAPAPGGGDGKGRGKSAKAFSLDLEREVTGGRGASWCYAHRAARRTNGSLSL